LLMGASGSTSMKLVSGYECRLTAARPPPTITRRQHEHSPSPRRERLGSSAEQHLDLKDTAVRDKVLVVNNVAQLRQLFR
jgi:hypothetical protein